ncbi:hypothetical protein RYR30_001955 [Flavobacterium psychrophilum]|nr:hypothetical protein [Flavobacterium psychrophilum]ELM3671994.1 hypothetical protein [Flavobacterium psychrophilum]ELM3727158.1 hypothetical protein [Flavobacterium psychrophilum]
MDVKDFIRSKNISSSDFMDDGVVLLIEDLIKEYSNQEKLIRQLFVGKVSEIIGFEKTVELLKEANDAFKK